MIKLNPETRNVLRNALVEPLANMSAQGVFTIEAWKSLASVSTAVPKDHKPKPDADPSRRARTALTAMIGEDPVRSFVLDYLFRQVMDKGGIAHPPGPLLQLLGTDASTLADELVGALERLPNKYTFLVPLSAQLGSLLQSGQNEFIVNDHICLVRAGEDFWQRFPATDPTPTRRVGDALIGMQRTIPQGRIVLQITLDGYVSCFGHTATVQDALLITKAFVAFCVAEILVGGQRAWDSNEQAQLIVYRGTEFEPVARQPFDNDASNYLLNLQMHSTLPLEGEASWRKRFEEGLTRIGGWLGRGVGARRLQLAGRWLFDSSATSDDVTGFVQAMIVLETLLGEGDPSNRNAISLGELLRNRCAYLLGETSEQRRYILEVFPKIYAVRSAIVHGGHHRLSSEEQGLLSELRQLCGRVIRAEGRVINRSETLARLGGV
ncbi:hypothetical protein [Bosea sp. LjRoot237]|uniref:hypothetical protein n=1 Tax=Bosea sp. LjRoot237 TaxID=3342292 RepID=UPI003ED0D4EE